MKNRPASLICRALLVAGTVTLAPVFHVHADDVKFTLESSGAGAKLRYYMPMRTTLSADKPADLKAAPDGVETPLYGTLKLGAAESPTTFYIVLDEPEGKPSRLFVGPAAHGGVDAGNGTFAGSEIKTWKGSKNTNDEGLVLTQYMGGADFTVLYGSETNTLHLNIYRFDKHDPNRAQIADQLFYYRDYAATGELTLGGKTYKAILANEAANGDFRGAGTEAPPTRLLVDINGDGKFDARSEAFEVGKPFNIGGTTYEITRLSASGTSFQVVKSSKTVEEVKPAQPKPTVAAGQLALPFQATTLAGKAVDFPASYKGKVVLLDFWATWCPPCRAEIPNIVTTYQKYHDQGFEVLSVSLDQENSADKVTKYTTEHHMDWPEIYDGKYWKAALAEKYFIDSIPHAFLVDGTTGKVILEGETVRGELLAPAVEKALAARTIN